MTSYQFEIAAKNAVIKVCREQYGEDFDIKMIQTVWFAHLLGNKKAILIDNGMNRRFYEVTYNHEKNEIYVDAYEKQSNTVIQAPDLEVHPTMDFWEDDC